MKICAISDTHEQEDDIKIPECDVLVCAGDITYNGSVKAYQKFADWLKNQPAKRKLIIFGNHDTARSEKQHIINLITEAGGTYLEDSGVEIDGLYFYGSPYTPTFGSWAYMLPRGEMLKKKWAVIPEKTNILVTHGPSYGILDEAPRGWYGGFENVGCQDLLNRIKQLRELKVHIFGHIHNSSGIMYQDELCFINAAICNEQYKPVNPVRVIEI